MKQFLGDYSKEIYGREIIQKVSISPKNIALTLEELEKIGVLSSRTAGNMRYYSINRKNPLARKYILLTEIENSVEFLRKHAKINLIFDKMINKFDNSEIICIFGSYAKGIEKKDSDLDIFAVGNLNDEEIKKIGKDYNIEINIKKGKRSDFANLLKNKNPLMNEIIENHILIFGYEKFVNEVIKQRWQ